MSWQMTGSSCASFAQRNVLSARLIASTVQHTMSSSSSDPQEYSGDEQTHRSVLRKRCDIGSSKSNSSGSGKGNRLIDSKDAEDILVQKSRAQLSLSPSSKSGRRLAARMSSQSTAAAAQQPVLMDVDVDLGYHIPEHHAATVAAGALDVLIDDEEEEEDDDDDDDDDSEDVIVQQRPRVEPVRPSTPISTAQTAKHTVPSDVVTPRAERSDPLSSSSPGNELTPALFCYDRTPDKHLPAAKGLTPGSPSTPIGSPTSIASQAGSDLSSSRSAIALKSSARRPVPSSTPVLEPSSPASSALSSSSIVVNTPNENAKLEKELMSVQWYKIDPVEDSSGDLFGALDTYLSQMEKLTETVGQTQQEIKAILSIIDDRQAQPANGQAFKRRKNAAKQRWFSIQDRLGVLARRAR